MKTHHVSLVMAALVVANVSVARELSPEQALDRARPSVSTLGLKSDASSPQTLQMTVDSDNRPAVYLFSNTSGSFLVLPADDAAPAVLGYGDSGSFSPSTVPPALHWWLGEYAKEIAMLRTSATEPVSEPGEGPVGFPDIPPILSTLWNQTSPYNLLAPEVNGEHCPAGCVATAMAQVMKHWNYPETGQGSNSYTPGGYVNQTLTLDFFTISFQWDLMTDSYSASSTSQQQNAVATLMYACGVAVDMNYSPNSSGSNYELAAEALVNNFKYDKGLRDLSRNYFGIDDWTGLIYNELKDGRPVLYAGRNENGGHAFVCDGYRTDGYFHFNWGWGGYSNGYFLVTALNPKDQGVGGSVGGYNLSQNILVGVQPETGNSEYHPVVEFMSDFEVASEEYQRAEGEAVQFLDTRGIYNNSLGGLSLVLGVKLVDEQGNVAYIGAEAVSNVRKGQGIRNYSIPIEQFPTTGTYSVTPAVKVEGEPHWFDAYVKLRNQREYTLQATPTSLTFIPTAEPTIILKDLKLNTSLYPGRKCAITATIINNSQEEYLGQVYPVLEQDNYEVAQAEVIEVNLEPGQQQEYEWVCSFYSSLPPGTYTLCMLDSDARRVGKGITVTVEEAPTAEPEPYVASVTINGKQALGTTEQTPVEVDLSNVEITMTVGCNAGYYSQVVNGAVWYDVSRGIEGLGGRFIGINAGQTADITVTHDLSGLEREHTYLLYVKGEQSGAIGDPVYFRADPASGITPVDAPDSFTIYTDGLTLHAAAPEPIVRLTLTNMAGMEILRTAEQTVDVSRLPRGIYIVTARTASGTPCTAKLHLP
ncbi:MAG: thiol protease/hemagglutinin PrtT [Firmicutes bacterium]|nr:thiol protease/hemagglutinin PrtT [Bacillota bacterium]MCM1402126.1 thiol protease/hemagglutinin PrtT [Bacteroides sp.]MCM1478016.1 thiol protease/hemagglutinin PrtT [Bacteroides sp.]